jgi:hypothetical protein
MTPPKVVDGWIVGKLPGPEGRLYTVEHVKRTNPAPKTLAIHPPNLGLHTTETDGLGDMPANHDFPPNAWVGDHRIVQTYRVNQAGHSVDELDAFLFQIEIVGRSQVGVWLPDDSSLFPLVALTAFLHQRDLIKTGLKRPNRLAGVPVGLDHLPAAVSTYYRRGLAKASGVYGHVDLAGDEHWNPGGFNYPVFFDMVRDVLEGDDVALTPEQERALKVLADNAEGIIRLDRFLEGAARAFQGKGPGANATAVQKFGHALAKTVVPTEGG